MRKQIDNNQQNGKTQDDRGLAIVINSPAISHDWHIIPNSPIEAENEAKPKSFAGMQDELVLLILSKIEPAHFLIVASVCRKFFWMMQELWHGRKFSDGSRLPSEIPLFRLFSELEGTQEKEIKSELEKSYQAILFIKSTLDIPVACCKSDNRLQDVNSAIKLLDEIQSNEYKYGRFTNTEKLKITLLSILLFIDLMAWVFITVPEKHFSLSQCVFVAVFCGTFQTLWSIARITPIVYGPEPFIRFAPPEAINALHRVQSCHQKFKFEMDDKMTSVLDSLRDLKMSADDTLYRRMTRLHESFTQLEKSLEPGARPRYNKQQFFSLSNQLLQNVKQHRALSASSNESVGANDADVKKFGI